MDYALLGKLCNTWRNYADIEDSWGSLFRIVEWYGRNQDVLQPAAGPGRWNDPDMVRSSPSLCLPPRGFHRPGCRAVAPWRAVQPPPTTLRAPLVCQQLLIGDFGLSLMQARVQVALWAVLAAPLFVSCNLRTISDEEKGLLQNPLMIYINQDPLGIQGRRIIQVGAAPPLPFPCITGTLAPSQQDLFPPDPPPPGALRPPSPGCPRAPSPGCSQAGRGTCTGATSACSSSHP